MADEFFQKHGFKVIDNCFGPDQVNFINNYTTMLRDRYAVFRHMFGDRNMWHHFAGSKPDNDVCNTDNFDMYGDPAMESLMIMLEKPMSDLTGRSLVSSYSFFREYQGKSSALKYHTDRPSCEFSISINITGGKEDPWPLCLKDRLGDTHEVVLDVGQGLVYLGCELPHWRPPKRTEGSYKQLFTHFVPEGSEWKYDKRPGLGVTGATCNIAFEDGLMYGQGVSK